MRKFKYGDTSAHSWDNNITQEVIFSCKSLQPIEYIVLMEKKAMQLCDTLNFGNYAERLIFLDAFYKGYIAAHCFDDEEEALKISLSPLGKALE